ncbi:recombinase family protein [Paenibacillus dendritiformis]|uniref:recombinase family protein n=1 Tax=Paenibacillus dendritiformis TaxID=130049 RepID=UPI000DA9378E|nr:recombinase family protein [Paenibacillus dendritiformis]PZM61730.1 recombinase family protein [Paenibacillus dendritiformis]
MTIAIYIRVSTDEQAQQGFSIDAQKERLQAYCVSQGWDDYKLYIDDGYSGTNLNRPAMKRLLRHVEEKKIKSVIVYKLDRLGRKQKDVLHLLEDVFEKNDVTFKSATEPFDTSTPLGKAMIGILAVFAQLERDMIIERTTTGRKQRIKKGKWPGGPVPFGYSWDKESQRLLINHEEAGIVKEIFRKYINGQSRLSIAEWVVKKSKARTFDHSVIRDMLSRPVYNGKLILDGKIVDGDHDAIISDEDWFAVQREISRRKDGLSPTGDYLLRGLLKCGVCGSNVVHVKRRTVRYGKEYLYELYACKNQHVRAKDKSNYCNMGYYKRKDVEEFVINQIKLISLNPNELKKRVLDKSESNSPYAEIDELKAKIRKLTSNLDNLYQAIQDGNIKASSVSSRIRSIEEERAALESRLDDLEDATPRTKDVDITKSISKIGAAWEYLEIEEQKTLIRTVVKEIELPKKGGDITLHWNV